MSDPALQTKDRFSLSYANYQEAICLLTKHYGQTHKITNTLMQAFVNMPAPENNVFSLWYFNNKVETYIRSLEALGILTDTFGALLIPIILKKLPLDVKMNLK